MDINLYPYISRVNPFVYKPSVKPPRWLNRSDGRTEVIVCSADGEVRGYIYVYIYIYMYTNIYTYIYIWIYI